MAYDSTQRAYSFSIASAEATALLERTHHATSAGASTVLNWMLSLAGGFHASRGVNAEARLMITRGWFSVESHDGAPDASIVAHDTTPNGATIWHLEFALDALLEADGLDDASRAGWIAEVRDALAAPLRPEAVWVNRRLAFDALVARVGLVSQKDIDDFFFDAGLFERERFLAVNIPPKAPDAIVGVGQWLCRRAGTGTGADFDKLAAAYAQVARALDAAPNARSSWEIARAFGPNWTPQTAKTTIESVLRAPGHKSRTKTLLLRALAQDEIDDIAFTRLREAAHADAATCASKPEKGHRPYADALLADVEAACGFAYAGKPARHRPYAVMFDLAARRFASVRSFIRNAERDRAALDVDNLKAAVPADVLAWCDTYAAENGAIRPRALGRWDDVLAAWSTCTDAVERVTALRALQRRHSREKIGNVNLFAEIAVDDAAAPVRAPGALDAYVAFAEARTAVAERKAPMLRHIDAEKSPVWAEFGTSRWPIAFEPTSSGATVTLDLLDTTGPKKTTIRALGARFVRDLGVPSTTVEGTPVSRSDTLGKLAANVAAGAPVKLALDLTWNGKLHFDRRSTSKRRTWKLSFSAPIAKRRFDDAIVTHLRSLRGTGGTRGGLVRHNLGRIPGLRLLGVNLGLRNAATCAVLETVTRDHVLAAARAAGAKPPTPDDLAFAVPANGGIARYRRIGPDILPDGAPHPCPWARIEQRFAIRLPGERKGDIRKASPDEFALVTDIARRLDLPTALPNDVDELQAAALKTVRRALNNHGRLGTATYLLSRVATSEIPLHRAPFTIERLAARATHDREIAAILERHAYDPAAPLTGKNLKALSGLVTSLTVLWRDRDPLLRATIGRLRKWMLPSTAVRDVGGLSVSRIENLRALRSAQVAYAMRAHPDAPGRPERVHPQYGLSLLEKIARIRRERTRLLVHHIVAAALGGPRQETTDAIVRLHTPCQAIVLEDLDHFKPNQSRSKRENSILRMLAHAQLTTDLNAACDLHGLFVQRVLAAYTSQEDGRDGSPGIRASAVPVETFVEASWWRERIEDALKNANRDQDDEEDRLLLACWSRWDPNRNIWRDVNGRTWIRQSGRWTGDILGVSTPSPIVLPDEEGPLFLSTGSPTKPTSADSNAATTIAASALLDPDWAGTYSHLPVSPSGVVLAERVKGSPLFKTIKPLTFTIPPAKTNDIINAWRRRSAKSLTSGTWLTRAAFVADVNDEICRRLREAIGTARVLTPA